MLLFTRFQLLNSRFAKQPFFIHSYFHAIKCNVRCVFQTNDFALILNYILKPAQILFRYKLQIYHLLLKRIH